MNTRWVWYSNNKDIKSPDTIHHVLMFGDMQDIQALKKTVGEETMRDLFLRYPKKIYTASALNFIKSS